MDCVTAMRNFHRKLEIDRTLNLEATKRFRKKLKILKTLVENISEPFKSFEAPEAHFHLDLKWRIEHPSIKEQIPNLHSTNVTYCQ